MAARHPAVEWIGLAEKSPNRASEGSEAENQRRFRHAKPRQLLKRPEVTCAVIATDESTYTSTRSWRRSSAALSDADRKPLAINLAKSARVLKAIKDAKLDAAIGYTQPFRRRWLAA